MGLIKDIKQTRKIVEDLNQSLNPTIINKAKKYDELMSYLSHLKFSIDKIVEGIDDFGNTKLFITFKSPTLIQEFNEIGEPIKNDFIYSINMLNLVSIEDFEKLGNVISKEKDKKIKK